MTYQNTDAELSCPCHHYWDIWWLQCTENKCESKYCKQYIKRDLGYKGKAQKFKCSKHYKHMPTFEKLVPDLRELLQNENIKQIVITVEQAPHIRFEPDRKTMCYTSNVLGNYCCEFDKKGQITR
eukprot:387355_1